MLQKFLLLTLLLANVYIQQALIFEVKWICSPRGIRAQVEIRASFELRSASRSRYEAINEGSTKLRESTE